MCGNYFTPEFLKRQWERAQSRIEGHHIHIYFDEGSFDKWVAQDLAEALKAVFKDDVTRVSTVGLKGPHTKPNIEVDITPDSLGRIVSFLQQNNHGGLSILIHPETGDDLRDHETGSLWLGTPVAFNQTFMERLRNPKPPAV